jgi:hypothetical protein
MVLSNMADGNHRCLPDWAPVWAGRCLESAPHASVLLRCGRASEVGTEQNRMPCDIGYFVYR